MSESRNVRDMLADAERAASTGDLVSAEELLRDAAMLQEGELGPRHPDLANTLNNLAIIAEKAGRLDDAETFYRRAVAIASASHPPDDPTVAASRKNLEDFCHAHGLPIDRPALDEPAAAEPPAPATPRALPLPPASRKTWGAPATLAIGMVALVTAALFIARPRSPRDASTARPASEPAPQAPAVEPAPPAPATLPPIDRTATPKVGRAPAPPLGPTAVALVSALICRNFSASDWRCDPAGDSVVPGPMVLYTRVRSPRDGAIVHRWYRGSTLRQSVQLRIVANAAEGYRTYSRQTVDRGDWRVEVRSVAGDLLHEQRLAVR